MSSTGGALRVLGFRAPDGEYRLTETWPEGQRPPRYSGAVLAPWPDRIRGGRFLFDGLVHQMAIDDAASHSALHGLVATREWDEVDRIASRVRHRIDVGLGTGWPYPLRLEVTHEVSEAGLRVTTTAENTGGFPAPFGLGVHPFVRAGDAALDDCTLRIDAGTRLPVDDRGLPTGPSVPTSPDDDFTAARPLAGRALDIAFSALAPDADGNARHELLDSDGNGVRLWTDASFEWLHALTVEAADHGGYPGRERALALVPMSCPPDAFNLGIDVRVLAPGRVWTGSWGLEAVRAAGS